MPWLADTKPELATQAHLRAQQAAGFTLRGGLLRCFPHPVYGALLIVDDRTDWYLGGQQPRLSPRCASIMLLAYPPPPLCTEVDSLRSAALGPLAGKRILTVDDQPESTRMIRLALSTALGAEVREVNQPAQALEVALDFRPDVVLLDVEMPGMNGGVLWRQLRAQREFRKLPIVFLTSRISQDEVSPNAADATTQMLAKPVTLARLTERLTALLGKPSATI